LRQQIPPPRSPTLECTPQHQSEREGGIKGVRTKGRRDERGWRGGEEDRGIDKKGEKVKREGRGDI
jgi:hypothetical protein